MNVQKLYGAPTTISTLTAMCSEIRLAHIKADKDTVDIKHFREARS